jgi:hypothetical protein
MLPNTYGNTTDIASLVPRYGNSASPPIFDATTRPLLAQVQLYCNQISGLINVLLAEKGFAIPVTQADAKLALDFFVDQEVASIAEGINGSGRFGPTSKAMGKSGRFALLVADAEDFIKMNAAGWERLGAARTYVGLSGLGYRTTDNRGNTVSPIFQRGQFGHGGGLGVLANTFINWDPEPSDTNPSG